MEIFQDTWIQQALGSIFSLSMVREECFDWNCFSADLATSLNPFLDTGLQTAHV